MSEKETELARPMTQQELDAFAERVEQIARTNNYRVVRLSRQGVAASPPRRGASSPVGKKEEQRSPPPTAADRLGGSAGPLPDQGALVVEGENLSTGRRLQLVAHRDDPSIRLEVEDRDDCERVLQGILDALGDDLVRRVIRKDDPDGATEEYRPRPRQTEGKTKR